MKALLLTPAAGVLLTLCSCSEQPAAAEPPLIINTAPVGEGLTVIGFAVLGAAVVIVLGRMIK